MIKLFMSRTVNKVILCGHLGRDPELKGTNEDSKRVFMAFSLATSSSWLDKVTNTWKENVQWHNCVVFDQNLIESCKKLNKGDLVYVEGSIQSRTINNPEGQKLTYNIVVKSVVVLTKHNSNGTTSGASSHDINDDYDDIPV